MVKIRPEVERIMVERFGGDKLIALATLGEGVPHVRNVNAYYENGAFYILTHRLSSKMRQIESNPAVALSGEWFTAYGTGASLGWWGKPENQRIAGKLRDAFRKWIDQENIDFDDENTIILRVELTSGRLFSHGVKYELSQETEGPAAQMVTEARPSDLENAGN